MCWGGGGGGGGSTKMDINKIACEDIDWILLAEFRLKWRNCGQTNKTAAVIKVVEFVETDRCQLQYRQSALYNKGTECSDLLDCYAVLTGKYLPTFRGEACRLHIQD